MLGATLVAGNRSGVIVEVEAYEGANDLASHAARGVTDRNRIMFGPAGRLYVYRIYGMHWCANVVCGPPDSPGAILIRALEPATGIEDMWADRPKAKKVTDLCSGPGKLCAALGIGGEENGTNLLAPGSAVTLTTPSTPSPKSATTIDPGPTTEILTGPRIGISKAVKRHWRFACGGNPHVSRPLPTEVFRSPPPPTGHGRPQVSPPGPLPFTNRLQRDF